MSTLNEVMAKYGYRFRLHREEVNWGWFKPTVVDLDDAAATELKLKGLEGLKACLAERLYRPPWGLWTFPSLDIEKPLPRRADIRLAENGRPTVAAVAPRGQAELWTLAQNWVAAIRKQCGLQVPLLDDDASIDLLDSGDLVVFGGSHQNRLALKLAFRYRTMFLDATVPGDDGWVVTTHCGLHAAGNNVLQIAAPPANHQTALDLLAKHFVNDGGRILIKNIHRIQPGGIMAAALPSWERFTDSLAAGIIQLQDERFETPHENIAALSKLLARGLESGGFEKGIYNSAPIDMAVNCALRYQLTADTRALELFRELLFRITDHYLKKPGGAEYPADLDFRLGILVLSFARLEHEPLFDDDDRLLLANLLLSCSRSVYEYVYKFWPATRTKGQGRHNHQTFPALSLLFAADYFQRFGLPEIERWRRYTDEMFACDLWRRSKQIENSRSYEPFVFGHAAAYSAFTGRELSLFDKHCFSQMVQRQIATTDNFFRPVDYGDTAISLNPADSVTARMLAVEQKGIVRWFAAEGFRRRPNYFGHTISDYPGLRIDTGAAEPPPAGTWERQPLDPGFIDSVMPEFPRRAAFDKLAFRTGWNDDDQYLLLEGVGCNVSHAHVEANGIVRLNHLGRHWLVSNGYGRRVGVKNASRGFSERECGPVDHNMLVLRRNDRIVTEQPLCALLQCGSDGDLHYATGMLAGYGGVDWARTLIILANRCLLVIDRIRVREPGLQAGHLEWNALGQAQPREDGFRLTQNGVFMDVTSPSNWPVEQGVADQSACWHRVLTSGAYPHAAFPLTKLVYRLPSADAGQTHALVTLFAATPGEKIFAVTQPAAGQITIRGPRATPAGTRIKDADLEIQVAGSHCNIKFDEMPPH